MHLRRVFPVLVGCSCLGNREKPDAARPLHTTVNQSVWMDDNMWHTIFPQSVFLRSKYRGHVACLHIQRARRNNGIQFESCFWPSDNSLCSTLCLVLFSLPTRERNTTLSAKLKYIHWLSAACYWAGSVQLPTACRNTTLWDWWDSSGCLITTSLSPTQGLVSIIWVYISQSCLKFASHNQLRQLSPFIFLFSI